MEPSSHEYGDPAEQEELTCLAPLHSILVRRSRLDQQTREVTPLQPPDARTQFMSSLNGLGG